MAPNCAPNRIRRVANRRFHMSVEPHGAESSRHGHARTGPLIPAQCSHGGAQLTAHTAVLRAAMQCAAARRTCADRAAPPLQRRAAPPTAVHAVMTAAPPAPQRRTADEYPRLANTRSECQYTRSGGRMQTHAQHASHIALVSKCVLFGHPPNAMTAVSATAAPKPMCGKSARREPRLKGY
jgi:hypothetical protein